MRSHRLSADNTDKRLYSIDEIHRHRLDISFQVGCLLSSSRQVDSGTIAAYERTLRNPVSGSYNDEFRAVILSSRGINTVDLR